MKGLTIGNKTSRLPIIQGGMGVGVSLHRLAGAVAREGGIGTISSADIGYREPDFFAHPHEANMRAIHKEMAKAREIAPEGIIGFNVMVATARYEETVTECVKAGADLIISGAGLPLDLPRLTAGSSTKIAPIVSSGRALGVIARKWRSKYGYTPDLVVVEGPLAGGHLGYKRDELGTPNCNLETILKDVLSTAKKLEAEVGKHIPVIAAGGIWDGADIRRFLKLGADGVQMGTRFVATEECDAAESYKQAYVNASSDVTTIIKSPVGMPGRAVRNAFLERTAAGRETIRHCYRCIKSCHVSDAPYCITKALIDAVKGDTDNGLIFCGSNVGRIREILPVKRLLELLEREYAFVGA